MSIFLMILNQLKTMLLPCLISLPIILIIRFIVYKKTAKLDYKREILIIFFWLYIVAVLSLTMIPEYEINRGQNEFPLHLPDFSDPNTVIYRYSPIGWAKWMITLGNYSELIRNIAGNILIFIPFGIMVPLIWKKAGAKTILFGILFSLSIEICQLFLPRQTDLYDLILNTIGIIIGYIVYLVITAIKKSKKA